MAEHNYFYYSLFLHIILLIALIVSYEFQSSMPVLENSNQNNQIINAVLMETTRIEIPKHTAAAPPPPPPKPLVKPVPKKIIKPIVAQPKAIVIPDKKKKQQELEKQLAAEIKQQKPVKQSKPEQKVLPKLVKHSTLEQEFAKELKGLTQKTQVAKIPPGKMQGIVDKYKALILQAISEQWIVPNNVNKNLTTQLMIRLSSDGTVLDVQLVKSSGDDGLDRSARAAVFKASPLPIPEKAEEYEPFKQFILKVKPMIVSG